MGFKMTKKENLKLKKPDESVNFILWYWPRHTSVIEIVFNVLPEDVKENLDLQAMVDGSNDPDEKFKDLISPHYPASYKRAVGWLYDAEINYDSGNYKRASYCFGIATRYIIDTFSAPHCISKNSNKDRNNFETVIDDYTPTVNYIPGDLRMLMQKGVDQGKKDWKNWKKSKNLSIPHSEADMGASVTYSVIKDILKSK